MIFRSIEKIKRETLDQRTARPVIGIFRRIGTFGARVVAFRIESTAPSGVDVCADAKASSRDGTRSPARRSRGPHQRYAPCEQAPAWRTCHVLLPLESSTRETT